MEQCYNKGCGLKFDPENNTDDACCYHPGAPVFHDALKSWSCCTKRVTDFTAFLDIKGCTQGKHSNVKPVEPPKPDVPETPVPTPLNKPAAEFIRPDENEPLVSIATCEISPSLRAAIEQERKRIAEAAINGGQQNTALSDGAVKVGTRCANKGCNVEYGKPEALAECDYHPGEAVFHEGMKFWSCCNRKTSDFTAFLEQRGCAHGDHRFLTPDEAANATSAAQQNCRSDWHQTGTLTTISVFAKNAVPERCFVRANHSVVEVSIIYDHGRSAFSRRYRLFGSVEPSASSLRFLQPKVEINLRKKDPLAWKVLEYIEPPKAQPTQNNENGDPEDLEDI